MHIVALFVRLATTFSSAGTQAAGCYGRPQHVREQHIPTIYLGNDLCCSILNSVLLAHPNTLSVSLREALSGLGNVSIPSDQSAAAASRAAFKDCIAQTIAEVDNRHMYPAFSSFICIQLLSDEEVRSFAPRAPAGTEPQAAARAYLAHLDTLAAHEQSTSSPDCMAPVISVPPSSDKGGFASILAPAGDSPSAALHTVSAFPTAALAASLQPHVLFGASASQGALCGASLIDWVQTNLSGEQLMQAAATAHPQLQEQDGLQRAKVQRILELLRGWCAAIALLPDPTLAPYTGKGASGTLQSGGGRVHRVPASGEPLRQLRVHSKAGLYKVEASRLVSLAPTPRTYATVLAACLDAGVTLPTHRLLLQLERTARPSVQRWALGCCSKLPAASTPLQLGLPPLGMSALEPPPDTPAANLAPLPADDEVDVSLLVFILQERFLHRLVAAGVLTAAAVSAALEPPPNTPQAAMLTAARSAALGNQKGSKHGAVVVQPAGGTVLVSGHNHSYTAPQKAHEVPLGHKFMPRLLQDTPTSTAEGGAAAASASAEARPSAAKRPRRDEGGACTAAAPSSAAAGAAPGMAALQAPVLPTAAEAAALELPPKLLHSRRNKVMHAEVHCISRLAVPFPPAETAAYPAAHPQPVEGGVLAATTEAAALAAGVVHAPLDGNVTAVAGCDVWVVELDAAGVGYEEAVPCTNCNVALIQQGVARVRYTCHAGVHSQAIRSNPKQPADTLQFGVNARVLNWIRHCQGLPPVPVPGQEQPSAAAQDVGHGTDTT